MASILSSRAQPTAVRSATGEGTENSKPKLLWRKDILVVRGRGIGSAWMSADLIKEWLRHRTGRLALALGIYALLFVLWVAFGASRLPHREAIGDLAFPPMGLTAAVLTWRLGSDESLKRRARVAWRTAALAMFFYAGGDLLWACYELVLGSAPFPS